MNRTQAAGILWPEVITSRANANLRSVVWRVQKCCQGVLDCSFHTIRLTPGVHVDTYEWVELARRVVTDSHMESAELCAALRRLTRIDLLPEHADDDWLVPEREHVRQLGLNALEALSERLIQAGLHRAALDAALAAVHIDPLRESAHRVLVRAHLAEGNVAQAHFQYNKCRELLRAELGVRPSPRFDEIIRNGTQMSTA